MNKLFSFMILTGLASNIKAQGLIGLANPASVAATSIKSKGNQVHISGKVLFTLKKAGLLNELNTLHLQKAMHDYVKSGGTLTQEWVNKAIQSHVQAYAKSVQNSINKIFDAGNNNSPAAIDKNGAGAGYITAQPARIGLARPTTGPAIPAQPVNMLIRQAPDTNAAVGPMVKVAGWQAPVQDAHVSDATSA